MLLAAWLPLCANVSLRVASTVLKALQILVLAAFHLGRLSSGRAGAADSRLKLPQDIRTVLKTLELEPTLMRHVMCPKCFKKYNLEACPETCRRRETRRSRSCGEELWQTQQGARCGPVPIPRRLYTTQNFETWLTHFVSLPEVESKLDHSNLTAATRHIMRDILDSPAWQAFGDYGGQRGNLIFGLFVDWFNPHSNKIAGTVASIGVICLTCFNLPPEDRISLKHIFFSGLVPGPNEPSVTTVGNVLMPLVEELLKLENGITIATPGYPNGRRYRVRLLPEVYDLVAMRKCCGLASHSATQFCSFCNLQSVVLLGKVLKNAKLLIFPFRRKSLESLDPAAWRPKIGGEILHHAQEWKDAPTHVKRKAIFQKFGVRWSPLNLLPYRDPVRHASLGILHNWLEGVLQYHVRRRWGLGISTRDKSAINIFVASEDVIDLLQIEEDIQGLEDENSAFFEESVPLHQRRLHQEGLYRIDSSGEESEDPDYIQPDTESESDADSTVSDPDLPAGRSESNVPCFLSGDVLVAIRTCLTDTPIPTWMERPPTNLGEKRHGKLKADSWLVLFLYFLPLTLLELWTRDDCSEHDKAMLDNFCHLAAATHIVCAHSTSANLADKFGELYRLYRLSARSLFPHAASVPNHHYSMHIPDLMKFWGPLMRISEFSGERYIGILQQMKTNGHIRECCQLSQSHNSTSLQNSSTLLCYGISAGKADSRAYYRSRPIQSKKKLFLSILNRSKDLFDTNTSTIFNPKALQRIPNPSYDLILSRLNKYHPSFQHHANLQIGLKPLSPWGIFQRHLKDGNQDYSIAKSHEGNAKILFRAETGEIHAGQIYEIWQVAIEQDLVKHFMIVEKFLLLKAADQLKDPFAQYPLLFGKVYYDRSDLVAIEPADIVCHAIVRSRPAGTFSIKLPTVVVLSTDRGTKLLLPNS